MCADYAWILDLQLIGLSINACTLLVVDFNLVTLMVLSYHYMRQLRKRPCF